KKGEQCGVSCYCPDPRAPSVGVGRFERACRVDVLPGGPPLREAQPAKAGQSHGVHRDQLDDDRDSGCFKVLIGTLECDNEKSWDDVDGQGKCGGQREHRPRIPRPVPIPRPLPNAIHVATLDAGSPLNWVFIRRLGLRWTVFARTALRLRRRGDSWSTTAASRGTTEMGLTP